MLTNLDAQWQNRFKEVREFVGQSLPDVDLTPYGSLDNGKCLCDEMMCECIQLFQQGMTVPVSDGSNDCAPPHVDRDGGPHLPVDWDEV